MSEKVNAAPMGVGYGARNSRRSLADNFEHTTKAGNFQQRRADVLAGTITQNRRAEIRITLTTSREGARRVDLRMFEEDGERIRRATGKGFTIAPELIDDLRAWLREAKRILRAEGSL